VRRYRDVPGGGRRVGLRPIRAGAEPLGLDVYYLEDTGWNTYDPVANSYGEDPSFGVQYLQASLEALSPTLGTRWHFRGTDGASYGVGAAEMDDIVAAADLLLNVSGMTPLREQHLRSKRKVLIDTDPGWNHFDRYPRWEAAPVQGERHGFRAHDHFFTYAQNMASGQALLPDYGLEWAPTRPPVVVDMWTSEAPGDNWTTVMTWDNYAQPILWEGVSYGSKEPEFARIERVAERVDAPFELAVGGIGAPLERWRNLGWSVVDAGAISGTLEDYRSYLQGSRGEFSVAKNVYVDTRSGWFSCRSVCYLAAGRPVVTQDTGWTSHVATGEGLFGFTTLENAVGAVDQVERDYDHHCEAARKIAETYFDSDLVLGELLARIGVS
jgi:hypothetical protein